MSKKLNKNKKNSKKITGFSFIKSIDCFSEYVLDVNGLIVIHHEMPGTGIVTTNITYRVGARDEAKGETGLAHMLEHMVFKPTKKDLRNKVDSGSMQFERETGAILNANTWKDRTTYFFSYPKEYTQRALHIEADRMDNVIISDREFLPERGNVLSEFDMNNGEPEFALSVAMVGTAFLSHTYGHETIGFREDIEDYTAKKLQNFYKKHYRPNNAVLMVFGDVTLHEALSLVKKEFQTKSNPNKLEEKKYPREPKQEGMRRVEVVRESNTNILALGVKHKGFPSKEWYETALLFDVLTSGPESILHKVLVDTGRVVRVDSMIEPTSDINLGAIFITLAKGTPADKIETEIMDLLNKLTAKDVRTLLKKNIELTKTDIFFGRGSSLKKAMDMTEFAAAGDWSEYLNTIKKIESITAEDIVTQQKQLFVADNMTIGNFIGKK